ncbi:Protein EMSY [Ooceraea biroi]|nr:Protein EMSY [Ooceraea biroi]
MVSVLRAQGPFTSEKQKLLQELAKVLHISNERHRAEIRRAVNDEKLAMIAKQLNGPNTGIDWTIEGRRTVPLLPRLKARSAFTILANSLSLATATANEKKPDKQVISGRSANSIDSLNVVETESQSEAKIAETLSVDTKSCKLENDVGSNQVLQENTNLVENKKTEDVADEVNKVIEKPMTSRVAAKRKCPSPLLNTPSNKVLVVSKPLWALEDKQAAQIPSSQAATRHQNVAVIPANVGDASDAKESATVSGHSSGCTAVPSNKRAVTTSISVCTSNANNKPKTIVSAMQSKVSSTKLVPAVSSNALNTQSLNKTQSESKDVQTLDDTEKIPRSENASSSPLCQKRPVGSLVHEALVPIKASNTHRLAHTVAVYPGTTVSSGPGPPQIKQVPATLMCKKLPSEETSTVNHQSTAKTSVTINSKKVVNMSHYPNAKLNAKTNVIVIQKGHAKGVTLSHAGKEVLGKVIMGGKNLCVTSQHSASSVSIQKHHISLNNGDQTTTSPANSSQSAETVKTSVKPGKTAVVSVVATHLRHDVLDKSKGFSQLFDSPVLNSESKTVVPSTNAHLPKEECNSEADTMTDQESSQKSSDSMVTFVAEEKQCRRNNDVNASVNSQVSNSVDFSKLPRSKEALVKPRQLTSMQDDAGSNTRVEDPDEDMDVFGATLDSTDMNLENFQYLADNNAESRERASGEPIRSVVIVNQVDEHDDS